MAHYFDEEGGDGKSCNEEEAVDEKEQSIIEDGVKTKFKIKVVKKEVRPMTHIFVVVLFSTK